MSLTDPSRRRFLRDAALLLGTTLLPASRTAAADAPAGRWNLAGPTPHLLFHYLPWFAVGKSAQDPTRIWTHWKWDGPHARHDPEKRLPDGRRDIASVCYPLIGPYSTWSRAVLRYHLRTARAAGAQGFVVDWNGPGTDTDDNLPALLDEAHRADMKVALMYEEKSNFAWPDHRDLKSRDALVPAVVGDLRYVLERYASHPAYLRRDGKPFLMQFNGWGEGPLGPKYLTPAEWEQVMARLPRSVAYARQGLDPAYAASTRGRYLWWSFNAPEVMHYNAQARQMVRQGQADFFVSMVCPRFDDTGVWGWGAGPRVTPAAGLSLLRDTLTHALPDGPELVQVVTFNDFNEGTAVEPTRENGFRYLDALATWWAARSGRTADLEAIRAPFREYARTCSPGERAELPPAPYDQFLARRPLTVTVPHYLDVLAAKPAG